MKFPFFLSFLSFPPFCQYSWGVAAASRSPCGAAPGHTHKPKRGLAPVTTLIFLCMYMHILHYIDAKNKTKQRNRKWKEENFRLLMWGPLPFRTAFQQAWNFVNCQMRISPNDRSAVFLQHVYKQWYKYFIIGTWIFKFSLKPWQGSRGSTPGSSWVFAL